MTTDTESHGPTEEAIRVAVDVHCAASTSGRQHDPAYRAMVEKRERASLEAAYPLIREQLCQELATAMREGHQRAPDDVAEPLITASYAAEFVESWATDRGGEDG